MLEIIERSKHVTQTEYSHDFRWADMPDAGFSFECDKDGNVDKRHTDAAKSNYKLCIAGEDEDGRKIKYIGLQKHHRSHRVGAVGKCACGRKVYLDDSWANTCGCGLEYNSSGQELAPRSQWGEETGEKFGFCDEEDY